MQSAQQLFSWPALPALVAGVGAVAFGAIYNSKAQAGDDSSVSVMTWNLLARASTKSKQRFHRNAERIEDPSQTRARYTMAGEAIIGVGSDVVLLQECEADFFKADWNFSAAKLLDKYHLYPCQTGRHPGTAILLKRYGSAVALVDKPLCIGGTEEFGGASKLASVVTARIGSKAIDVVSTQFASAQTERHHHAATIAADVGKHSLIVGGDFNCEGSSLADLGTSDLFRDMRQALLPEGTTTALGVDFSKKVLADYVYASSDLELMQARALAEPTNPWGGKVTRPAKVSGASHHVPIVVTMKVE